MQHVQFIIQPAFGFMNPINEYWSHQYQCAMQFYLNENSTHFGCREGDSFVLLCLSLAALKRCFANHVQRLQLPHHLSRSPGNMCLPPSVWQSNLCPAGCLLKAEQPNPIPLTLSAVSFLQSQWQSCKVSSLTSLLVLCVTGPWQLKSPTSGKGKARPASQEKTGIYFQGTADLPSGRQIKQKLPYPNCFCTKVDSSGSTPKDSSPCSNFQTSPCPRRTFQRWGFQSRVYLAFTLSAISVGKVELAESYECSPIQSVTEQQCKICLTQI